MTIGFLFLAAFSSLGYRVWRHLQRRASDLQAEIAAHRKAREALEASERRFRFITESSGDVIWTLDISSWKCTYVSEGIVQLLGYAPHEYVGKTPDTFLPRETYHTLQAAIAGLVAEFKSGKSVRSSCVVELEQPHRDGQIIHTEVLVTLHPDDFGEPRHVLGITRDITARRTSEKAIRTLAYYDGLTKLPNRRMLSDRLQQAIARGIRDGSKIALLFMDLDNFKPVNDAFGHEVGDWLLQSAAERMIECLRPYDTAARIGGDEFAILLPDLHSADEALAIAERLRLSLQLAFETPDARRIQISSSIGIALCPDHAHNERDLLRVGDEAMYRAKRDGRNNVFILPPEVRVASRPFRWQ